MKGFCSKTPCDKHISPKYCPEDKYCDKTNSKVCTKMMVLHANEMSRYAGVLVFKRTSCFKGKCSVFKVASPFTADFMFLPSSLFDLYSFF